MAERDGGLPPATRNYVIFGLLLIVALALAARDHFGPHHGHGESDSGLRLMIVDGSPGLVGGLDEVDGFSVIAIGQAEAIALGREHLDDDDDPPYLAAIAHADQLGCGFVILGLEGDLDAEAWGLVEDAPGVETPPTPATPYVVFSVGDLAPEGPRMTSFEPAPVDYVGPLRELDSVRLALYQHPDLLALWRDELPAAQVQARQVLQNRGLPDRREDLLEQQRRLRELLELWPEPGAIAGDLSSAWEEVRAAPVRGGVLVATRRARPTVESFRTPRLSRTETTQLWFVAQANLGASTIPAAAARIRCEGLPEAIEGEIVVAPDGASVVIADPTVAGPGRAAVFTFAESAAATGGCTVARAANPRLDGRSVGRSHASGQIAWTTGDDALYWTANDETLQRRIYGIDDFSGPWWVDTNLLATLGVRPLGPPTYGVDTILALFDPSAAPSELDGQLPVAVLGPERLFPAPEAAAPQVAPQVANGSALLDLRPCGPSELLLLTEHCTEADIGTMRPCLHRLTSEVPLIELTRALVANAEDPEDPGAPSVPAFRVETLGSIGPYHALAIAADGSRAVWSTSTAPDPGALVYVDLRTGAALAPTPVVEDELDDVTPRISADGRVVVTATTIDLGPLGPLSIARAFVLPEPAAPSPEPTSEPPTPEDTP